MSEYQPEDMKITPWRPETDPIRLAVFGKLIEECNELGSRAARCIIQGMYGMDPDKGRENIALLREELADVQATMDILHEALQIQRMPERVYRKRAGFRVWHDMIRAMFP